MNKKTYIQIILGIIVLIGSILFYISQGQIKKLEKSSSFFYKTTSQQAKNQFIVEVEFEGEEALTYTSYEFHNPYNDVDYLENYDQFKDGKITKEGVDEKCALYNKVQKEQFPLEKTKFTIDTCYSQYNVTEDTYYMVYKYQCKITEDTLQYLCVPDENAEFDNLAKNMVLANALKKNKNTLDKSAVITALTSKYAITTGQNSYELIEDISRINTIKKELNIE